MDLTIDTPKPITSPEMTQLITSRMEEIRDLVSRLTRERRVLEDHRRMLSMGSETPEQVVLALQVAKIDPNPLLLQQLRP